MSLPPIATLVGDVARCLVFFTRLPLPPQDFVTRSLAQSLWAAPVAGLAPAFAGGLFYTIAALSGLSAQVGAALALAATMLVTGCLHEDGLSDVADGFGGGQTADAKLEIMRDSRIGAFGACALIISVLLRWSAMADLARPIDVFAALIAAHCASRALLPAFLFALPPARPDGLGAANGGVSSKGGLTSLAFGAAPLLLLGLGIIPVVLCLGCVFLAFRLLCLRQIGGQTGDTAGALQQVAEMTVLLCAAAIFH